MAPMLRRLLAIVAGGPLGCSDRALSHFTASTSQAAVQGRAATLQSCLQLSRQLAAQADAAGGSPAWAAIWMPQAPARTSRRWGAPLRTAGISDVDAAATEALQAQLTAAAESDSRGQRRRGAGGFGAQLPEVSAASTAVFQGLQQFGLPLPVRLKITEVRAWPPYATQHASGSPCRTAAQRASSR